MGGEYECKYNRNHRLKRKSAKWQERKKKKVWAIEKKISAFESTKMFVWKFRFSVNWIKHSFFPRQKSSQPHIRLFFLLSHFAIWLEKKNRMRAFCSWRVWFNEFTRWKLEMCARFCCCSSNLLNLLRVSDDSVRKRVN